MRAGNRAGGWRVWAFRVGIGLFFFITGFAAGPASVQAFDADNLVNAVDISHWSGTITDSEVACWRDSNFSHVITGTQNRDITVQQLQTAVNRGMTVDAYVMLHWDYDIAGQVHNALEMIAGFPVGRLWLDAEQPAGGRSAAQLIQLVQQAADACGSMPCGVNVDYNIMVVSREPEMGADPGEVGSVTIDQPDSGTWHTVNFINRYIDPVVIMQPASYNGGDPTTVRIRNVTETSFEFQMDEWDYLDGAHTTETIGYLAVEAGTYELQNGIRFDAGLVEADDHFIEMPFYQTFTTAPVVLTQVQSTFGSAAVATRQRAMDVNGFQVRVQEEEGNDGAHAVETVGYIAIVPGTGQMGDMAFEVQRTPDAVDHTWYPIDFQQTYTDPIFLAGMQTYNGGNTAGVRYSDLEAGQTRVFVEEEKSADTEIWHVTEIIGYAVFDHAGSLSLAGPPLRLSGPYLTTLLTAGGCGPRMTQG